MSWFVHFPLICILLSLLTAAVSIILPEKYARYLTLALLFSVVALSACTLYYDAAIATEAVTYRTGRSGAVWGTELRFSIVEPLTALAFALSMLLCLIGGKTQLTVDVSSHQHGRFYAATSLVLSALLALIYTNDLFIGYVFVEVCTLASCGLMMIKSRGGSATAAMRYMIFSLLGSGLVLLGVALLYDSTGQWLMPNIRIALSALHQTGLYQVPLSITVSLITLGVAIKSGLFPFHYWMPDAYGCATPVASGILAGLVPKAYIFFLIKIIYRVIGRTLFYAAGAADILFVLGCAAIIAGALSAIRENDISRMIACSVAAQIGYVFLGIGIATEWGMDAELFHIYFHALTKPALFLAAAQLSAVSGGSHVFRDLQGSAHRNKLAGVVFTVGAVSMVGLPGLMGFISKAMFATAALSAGNKTFVILIILCVSTVLNAVYFLRTVVRIYTPAPAADPLNVPVKAQPAFAVSGILFVLCNFAIGLHPQPVIDLIVTGLHRFG